MLDFFIERIEKKHCGLPLYIRIIYVTVFTVHYVMLQFLNKWLRDFIIFTFSFGDSFILFLLPLQKKNSSTSFKIIYLAGLASLQ